MFKSWNNYNSKSLIDYCKNKNMRIDISNNFITIHTNISNWMIMFDSENIIKLLHYNLYKNKKDEFHTQKKYNIYKNISDTEKVFDEKLLMKILNYIYQHDKQKMIKNKKRTYKIDRLYNKIEKSK